MDNRLEHQTETVERKALISLYTNATDELRTALGLTLHEIDDAVLLASEQDPSILINRTQGPGTQHPVRPETIGQITDCYSELGINNYFLHLYRDELSQPAHQQLAASGLIPARGWMRFIRDAAPPRPSSSELRVEKIGSDHADEFGRVVCNAFDMSDASIPLVAALVNDPRWHLYASFTGDTLAGTGALFIDDGIGWLDWAATTPEFRCRGSQSAIMAARIEEARTLGCHHLVTETGEAVEGDPQHSYRNILKHGFKGMRIRHNYRPSTL